MSEITENVQVDETVDAGGKNVDTPELHGHDDHGSRNEDLRGQIDLAGGSSDEDQDDSQGHDDPDSNPGHDDPGSDQPDTFPREYVEKLRKENAGYREKAKHADELAHRLHTALVAADGRLADPTDLPFDAAHLDDPDALAAAVTALVRTRPGLKAQQVRGDVGAGDRGTPKKAPVDLISIMRGM